jgi:hypothetical protein
MKKYKITVKGEDVFYITFIVTAQTITTALSSAYCIEQNDISKLTIEQTRIVAIQEI